MVCPECEKELNTGSIDKEIKEMVSNITSMTKVISLYLCAKTVRLCERNKIENILNNMSD